MRSPIKLTYWRRGITFLLLVCFFVTNINGPLVRAQEFSLPAPGQMVALSPAFSPDVLKGIKLDPKNPFRFHFFVDRGDTSLSQEELKSESSKLIKYFLASLTIREKDLWVNLSPYEKDRIVPQEFGQTEMGRDLLAEDYLLKQITASLIYPESQLGKAFWQKVYAQAQAKYGTTNIPINTFNKVWIVPEKAVVYENGGVAFVLENHLKVMLEQDYLSLEKHTGIQFGSVPAQDTNQLGSQIVREIVIPALTKEVNEGKNFSQLRQVFYSLILATWYKKKIKDSILNKVYSNRNKIGGLNVSAGDKDRIYQEYLKAFKKGVYNYIKEEPDQITGQAIPRKYFSGGVFGAYADKAIVAVGPDKVNNDLVDNLKVDEVVGDLAMNSKLPELPAGGTIVSHPAKIMMVPATWLTNEDIRGLIRQIYTELEINDILNDVRQFNDVRYLFDSLYSVWRPHFAQVIGEAYTDENSFRQAFAAGLPENIVRRLKAPADYAGHKLSKSSSQIGFRTDLLSRYLDQKIANIIRIDSSKKLKIALGGTSLEEVRVVAELVGGALKRSAQLQGVPVNEYVNAWDVQIVAYSIDTSLILHIKQHLSEISRPEWIRSEYLDLLDEFQMARFIAEKPDIVISSRSLYIPEYYAGMGNPLIYPGSNQTEQMISMRTSVKERFDWIRKFVNGVYRALPVGGAFFTESPYIFQPDFPGFQYVSTPLDSVARGSGMMIKMPSGGGNFLNMESLIKGDEKDMPAKELLSGFSGGLTFELNEKDWADFKISDAFIGEGRARFDVFNENSREKIGSIDLDLEWMDKNKHRAQVTMINAHLPSVKEIRNLVNEWLNLTEFKLPSGSKVAVNLKFLYPDLQARLDSNVTELNRDSRVKAIYDLFRDRWLYNIETQIYREGQEPIIRVVGTVDKDKLEKDKAMNSVRKQTDGAKQTGTGGQDGAMKGTKDKPLPYDQAVSLIKEWYKNALLSTPSGTVKGVFGFTPDGQVAWKTIVLHDQMDLEKEPHSVLAEDLLFPIDSKSHPMIGANIFNIGGKPFLIFINPTNSMNSLNLLKQVADFYGLDQKVIQKWRSTDKENFFWKQCFLTAKILSDAVPDVASRKIFIQMDGLFPKKEYPSVEYFLNQNASVLSPKGAKKTRNQAVIISPKLTDEAMNVAEQKSPSGPGGIDLNPAQLSMQVKKDGQDFKFNFNGTEIDAAQVTGATFTIRTMTPVVNLPQVLGLNLEPVDKPKQPVQQLASL